MSEESPILFGLYVPPHPQPLLSPDANQGYANLRAAFETCRKRIEEMAWMRKTWSTAITSSFLGKSLSRHPGVGRAGISVGSGVGPGRRYLRGQRRRERRRERRRDLEKHGERVNKTLLDTI